ncbi:hypothetical protein MLD38_021919 [Melastoma candidum]|uniref:Uncharacterized protein n=1 Tax=Melastoma candidum TaxID=119954 RepID=A0ACB9QIJ4_9MYRT|nr:hypothetical protein MLD38_021919 [Melastoma candidum]
MAIDLMERMLVFDPSRRLTTADALHHPYLAGLYDPSTDMAAKSTEPLKAFNRMNEGILRKVIYQEMRHYNICYYTLFGERVDDREFLEILSASACQ